MNDTPKRATATRRSVESLIKKRFGKNASLRENPKAPTPADREAARLRLAEIRKRIDEIAADLKALHGHDRRLLTAAEFVCDVNGDSPSIDQLRTAVEQSGAHYSLAEERAELEVERRSLSGFGYRRRWDVCVMKSVAGMAFVEVPHYADTLDELAAMISGKAASDA